jgi:hypothetical protein
LRASSHSEAACWVGLEDECSHAGQGEDPAHPLPACPAIDNVRVLGHTATQAVLAYSAPGAEACSLQISESNFFGTDYSPVHDVNMTLFQRADSDARIEAVLRACRTDNVVVEFGYGPEFRCNSSRGVCLTASPTVDETAPFAFESESPAGVPCASACTVTIPQLPLRVLYYRAKYRAAGGASIATGGTQIAVSP